MGFIAAKDSGTFFSVGVATNTAQITNVIAYKLPAATGWLYSGGAVGSADSISLNASPVMVYKDFAITGYTCTGSSFDVVSVSVSGTTIAGNGAPYAADYVASARPGVDCAHGYIEITLVVAPSTATRILHSSGGFFYVMITQLK